LDPSRRSGDDERDDRKEVSVETMPLFEPFAPLFELTRDLDRLFGNDHVVPSFVPAADVVVTDDNVTVLMDVPGLTADDLEIELVDDVLTVRGERWLAAGTQDEQAGAWQRIERGFGRFERVLRVPKGLDADQIGAEMDDGVLTLHIPKPQAQQPRRIEIATGAPAAIEETAGEQRELSGTAA
jgi:HSP20 family protein